jgi:hypothetical protein
LESFRASFIKRHTEALEMLWRLATCVSDIKQLKDGGQPNRNSDGVAAE